MCLSVQVPRSLCLQCVHTLPLMCMHALMYLPGFRGAPIGVHSGPASGCPQSAVTPAVIMLDVSFRIGLWWKERFWLLENTATED